MKDLARVMSETRKMYTILLAGHRLGQFSLFDIKYLNRLVVPGRYEIVTLVVKVKRRNMDCLVMFWGSK